jgi:hypothetical protein
MNLNDGDFVQWIACSNTGGNTTTEFGTPTDLRFPVPQHAAVTNAFLDTELYGSGTDARVRVACVNSAGTELAQILPTTLFGTAPPRQYSWAVPTACFAAPTVTIRFERIGSNCLAIDQARLYAEGGP